MPDATSYLIAAYALAAVVLLGYGIALLRRAARATRRADALGVDGGSPEPADAAGQHRKTPTEVPEGATASPGAATGGSGRMAGGRRRG